ncbi:unnamed protein product [Spodoptera littoralis]|uniref:NADP-dependent oxidoreductase domain-containing protein n=1 Tax=Spodoptera littoralis TaxID=7109 RepID=A0A9P0N292_SPOLI|nr:unnamed protein product [Spodoptera littoralis]CAH1641986.1 unnamed protein product [Spodoptera littoralis]
MEGEEKSHEEKKSKIPMLRLRQAVERVKRERQAQKEKAKPRRSSIPKLKDPKKVKRDTSLKFEPQVDDEFEKLYEEIVDDKPVEAEVKLPLVSIDDPEKIETKFEELIHAYDEEETAVEEKVVEQVANEERVAEQVVEEENVVEQVVEEENVVEQVVEEEKPSISKVSKIPALRKKEDSPSMRALMERVKEVSAAEAKLKDGGFKVTASNIRTKRYSRGNSDLSRDEQQIDSIEEVDVKEEDDVFDKDNAQSIEIDSKASKTDRKVAKTRSGRSKSELIEQHRQAKLREELRRKQKKLRNEVEDPVIVDKVGDNIDDLNAVLMKTERIVRNISREINDDKKSIINIETVTTEEQNNDGTRTITTKTVETFEVGTPVVQEKIIRNISRESTGNTEVINDDKPKKATTGIPVKTERFTRGISREMGNFKQSIHREIIPPKEDLNSTDNKVENKPVVTKETMKVEQIEKEGIKVGIPVFTKITRSYSKGKVQNVEMSRTIEWKPADVVTNKAYARSVSEKVTKNELKDTNRNFDAPASETHENNAENGINGDSTRDTEIENNIKHAVKEAAKTKSIRKVTEFKTEEQVTNEERTTFTLSRSVDLSLENDFKAARAIGTQMSVDGQNIDRDYKIGKDASTRISVINDKINPKGLKPSREIGTQMSVDVSTVQEEKYEENNKEQSVNEKNKTKDSNLPVKDKDSDITPVTTLKGNVSRLKEKIAKDKEIVSKRDKEAEFPKKKSVLSKIAMFERLEKDPIEQLPLRKLKCKYVPPTKPTYHTEEQEEEVTNTVVDEPKEEPQSEPNNKEDKVEISAAYDAVTYTNEPIIVKEYLKSEYNENLLKDNKFGKEETPGNIEEDATNLDDIDYTEPVSPLPEIVNLDPNDSIIEIPKTPEPRKDTEMPTIFPPRKDYEADIGRTRPGKLNLNNWTSQVEINKSTVDKIAVFKEEQIQEIVQTLPSIDIKAYASQVSISQELPRNIDEKRIEDDEKSAKVLYEKVEIQFETPQTIPEVIDVTSVGNIEIKDEYQHVDDENLPPDEIDTQSYDLVPETDSGCPVLTVLDLEALKLMNASPGTRESLVEAKPKPGKLDLSLWKNKVEENRNNTGKDIKNKPKNTEIRKEAADEVFRPRRISDTVPLIMSLNNNENKDETPVDQDNKTNDNTYNYAITDSDVSVDEIYTSSSESDFEESFKGKAILIPMYGMANSYKKDVEKPKPKPGKLDLGMWKNQVEANRSLVDKDKKNKSKKPEITTEALGKKVFIPYIRGTTDVVQGKDDPNNADNKDKTLETGTEHKSEIQVEIETILPETVEAKSADTKPETAKPFIALIDVNKHVTTYVPNKNNVNEEQPKIHQGKIDLETGYTYECKAEIGVHKPDTVCFTSADYLEENVTTLPAIITFETDNIEVESPKPGKLDLKAWEDQVEANKVLVDKIEVVRNEHLEDVAKILTEKVDFVTFEHVGQARMFQATVDIDDDDNKVEIAEADDDLDVDIDVEDNTEPDSNIAPLNYIFPRRASRDDQLNDEGNKAQIINQLVSESLSDPELVDEKTNINKDSVVGSVKRKLYFLSSISRSHNPVIREDSREIDNTDNNDGTKEDEIETKAYIINDLGPKSNAASIEDIEAHTSIVTENNKPSTPPNTAHIETADMKGRSNENVFHFDVARVENRMTRSVYGVGEFKNSTEDIKRAKSLAELDLGDAVQGKVKSILSRINSVDFGRRESIKTSISVKEMPKKMSVLEKIALFEGKLTSPQPEPPTAETPTDVAKPVPGISEEAYLKKIKDLQSAKVLFGKMDNMNSVALSDGTKMPVLAVGTALLDARLLKHIIGAAIDMGYRAIDTAYIYGNEKDVGEAIQAKIDDGTVTREQLFIMGKLWSTFHKTDLVENACKDSLEALGITYFDLYMIHNPMSFKEGPDPIPKIASVVQFSEYDYLDAWYGMEGLVGKGLAKTIGVSNFNSVQLQRILDKGKIPPVVNQVECHPYLTQQRLDAFCREKNIQLSCYGVLGSKGTPAEYKNSTFAVIDDPLVKVMASGLGVSPAQLLIRYQIDCGHNVVVKASCAAHLWDNLQALTFNLDKAQIEALHALNKNKRTFTFNGMGETHKNYPFLEPF